MKGMRVSRACDKTRPSSIFSLQASGRERTVALTLTDPPGEADALAGRDDGHAVGISAGSVQRIWWPLRLRRHTGAPV